MSSSSSSSNSLKKSLASLFKSPAVEKRTKVLAASADQAEGDTSSINSDLKAAPLSDEEKAKRLVEKRDASSPSGHFVLGQYKPAGASQGYAGYYEAQGALGK